MNPLVAKWGSIGDAQQATLSLGLRLHGDERCRQQHAVLDDPQRAGLLTDEEPAIGCERHERRLSLEPRDVRRSRESRLQRHVPAEGDPCLRPGRQVACGIVCPCANDMHAGGVVARGNRMAPRCRCRVAHVVAVYLVIHPGHAAVVGCGHRGAQRPGDAFRAGGGTGEPQRGQLYVGAVRVSRSPRRRQTSSVRPCCRSPRR